MSYKQHLFELGDCDMQGQTIAGWLNRQVTSDQMIVGHDIFVTAQGTVVLICVQPALKIAPIGHWDGKNLMWTEGGESHDQ